MKTRTLLDTRKNPPTIIHYPLILQEDLQAGAGVAFEMIVDGEQAGSMRVIVFHRRQGEMWCVYDTLAPYHVQQLANMMREASPILQPK